MSTDKDKLIMELRSEIETLHAEHAHDIAPTQTKLQAKSAEILLQNDLATSKAKGIKDLDEAQLAHQTDHDIHSEAIPPSVVNDL